MTSRSIRSLAAASVAAVSLVGAGCVVAALPTTRVVSVRQQLPPEEPGREMAVSVGRGAHVSLFVGNPSLTIDHQYFATPCALTQAPGALAVDCPHGLLERWFEPSRVWVVAAVPPNTRVTVSVHRDGYFRAESGVIVSSLEQREDP